MRKARILIYDLETAGVNALNSDLSVIICFGYKWFGSKRAYVLTIDQFPGWFSEEGLSDKPLVEAALKIMSRADIIVAHYGDEFDRPYFQGRCVLNGLTPPPPAKQRDTWQIARRCFRFSSNRLQHLADALGVKYRKHQKKVPSEWPGWWMKALAGNRAAIRAMARYCRQDVWTLEEVYRRLQPYDTAHPILTGQRAVCGLCGGPVQYRGYAYARRRCYRRFQCTNPRCGHWGRESTPVRE